MKDSAARSRVTTMLVSLGLFASAMAAAAQIPTPPAAGEITPRMILSVNSIQDVRLSPDGRKVLYELRRTDWEGNRYKTELWLVGTEAGAKPRKLIDGVVGTSPYRSVHATWRPDGRAITYFLARDSGDGQIWETDVESGVEKALTQLKGWKEINPRGIQPTFLKWSPDGSRVAFVMNVTQPVDPNNDPGDTAKKGYDASVYYPNESYVSLGQLWVLTAADGTAKRVSREDLSVMDIEWSPDSKRMVVSAMPVPKEGRILNHYATNGLDNDLYLIDLATGDVKPLVAQPGWEEATVWSPDGRWIAFQSQHGIKDWNYTSYVAVVAADGGPVRYLDEEFEKKRGSTGSGLVWDARSEGVYFTAMYRGRRPLFHASASRDGKESVEEVTSGATFYNHYSIRPGANVVACSGDMITYARRRVIFRLWTTHAARGRGGRSFVTTAGLPGIEEVEWKNDGMELHGYL